MPATAFDHGRDICLYTILTGDHCYGCGMTRACMHLIHLDFLQAWQYNKICYVVLPILCGLVIADYRKTILALRAMQNPADTTSDTTKGTPE